MQSDLEQKQTKLAKFVNALEQFFHEEQLVEKHRKKVKKQAMVKSSSLIPNKYMALALDNALQHSAGLPGMSYFCPLSVPRALQENELRYFMELEPKDQLPGTSTRRACILDKTMQQTRVEVPRAVKAGALHRPVLHKALDEGSIGLPMVLWADLHMGLRSTSTEDCLAQICACMLQHIGMSLTIRMSPLAIAIHVVAHVAIRHPCCSVLACIVVQTRQPQCRWHVPAMKSCVCSLHTDCIIFTSWLAAMMCRYTPRILYWVCL